MRSSLPLRKLVTGLTLVGLGLPCSAFASCGSAFCVLNTQWETQGVQTEPGRGRVDIHYEFIRQDRLWSGGKPISAAEDDGDTVERSTLNRNLVASLDYSFDKNWGISVSLPAVSRDHRHIADPVDDPHQENWSFTKLADVRALGRYQFDRMATSSQHAGLLFGAKLPSGDYRVVNGEGVEAERALQPGTGSTDLILGAFYAFRPPHLATSWFAQLQQQRAVATKEGFRPGDQTSVSGGVQYPFSSRLALLVQLNALHKDRDSGINAEPELSGGRYLFASPGVSYSVSKDLQLYGFVQEPLLRHVNGIQLTADRSWIAGLSTRF